MRRKLTELFPGRTRGTTKPSGFTLTEVIVVSSLLIIAIVPILKALTTAHLSSTLIRHKTRSLTLAQAKLDEIKARSIYNYATSFAESSAVIDGSYLCTVKDVAQSANLRNIEVLVGHDADGNGILASNEIFVTLETLISKRW